MSSKNLQNIPTDFSVLDGRTRRARIVRNAYSEIMSDLGGEETTSQNQREIARRIAFLAGMAAEAEQELAENPFADAVLVKQYMEINKALASLTSKLGMERKAKDVDPMNTLRNALEGSSKR